jgi:hypothetical protein
MAQRIRRKKRQQTEAVPTRHAPPTFSERSVLVRYIDEDQRFKTGRPAPAAFMANPGEKYLSVNSLEVESLQDIAAYYRVRFTPSAVAVTQHKVTSYNDAARKGSVALTRVGGMWHFTDGAGTAQLAYEQHPVPARGGFPASPSHSGFECVRVMNELNARKAARHLAKGKFHIF